MEIKRFYDEALAHASYAITTGEELILVDPGRDPRQYLDYAAENGLTINSILETHPHADFISSHVEFATEHQATIFINPKAEPEYDYKPLDHEQTLTIGDITFKALFTPGHSPDHNSYLLLDENDQPKAIFTGDALFIGDVGRPDLREGAGNQQVSKEELAEMMYDTVNDVFRPLPDDLQIYPAHGAGSLCGKNMSDELTSDLKQQKDNNWAFQIKDKGEFVKEFLNGQAFIPHYFPHDVKMNLEVIASFGAAVNDIPIVKKPLEDCIIVDCRSEEDFKKGHYDGAINIQYGEKAKFETWLGSLIKPDEDFCLVAGSFEELQYAIQRVCKIGYERNCRGGIDYHDTGEQQEPLLDVDEFANDTESYTIVDIRNQSEFEDGKFFEHAINIPLPELRERTDEVPTDKPIVVHCAGGYRSAAGSSILSKELPDATVYDLSDDVERFK